MRHQHGKETFRVSGMACSEEVAAIRRAAKPFAGVPGVRANIVARQNDKKPITKYIKRMTGSTALYFEVETFGANGAVELLGASRRRCFPRMKKMGLRRQEKPGSPTARSLSDGNQFDQFERH